MLVPGASCLDAASAARFEFARVRWMRLIDWSKVDPDGTCHQHWDWERPTLFGVRAR
jgi:hypothetical protein